MSKKIVVIGAGLMGASAAYQLAVIAKEHNQPVDITVLESAPEGMQRGGSMGASRITRLNTRDVPAVCLDMIVESNQLAYGWECATPRHTLTLGNWKEKLDPARDVAKAQGVRHNILDSHDIQAEYPFLNAAGCLAVDEAPMTQAGDGAGTINPQKLIGKLLEEAQKAGATIRYNEAVSAVSEHSDGVKVTLADGHTEQFDKAITAAGVWTSKLLGAQHPVTDKITTTIEPLYYYKAAADKAQVIADAPVVMLKIRGGDEFARQHPDFVAAHPEFARSDARFQAYVMPETQAGEQYLKIGVFAPMETTPKDPDMLLAQTQVTQAQQQLAADIIRHFMPGLATALPSLAGGQADKTMLGPYACAPDYTPVISPLHPGSHITVIAADAGTSAKFAVASGKYAAAYALGHDDLIPPAAREVFSIDRDMQKAAMPEQSLLVRKVGGAAR